MFRFPQRYLALSLLVASSAGVGCVGNVNGREEESPTSNSPSANSPSTPNQSPSNNAPSSNNSASNTPSAPRDPAGVKGILGCPTTPLPAYGGAVVATLSEPFQRSCAACHGGAGEGNAKYPAIPGKLTQTEFLAKVRVGVKEMPPYGADFITDAQLTADFASLSKLAGQPGGAAVAASGPSTWSEAKLQEVYTKGLAVWRKAGSVDGQACTNCHSADGVEMAIIGFPDDAILRRGQQHLSPEDALSVRDFIHAQRRRLGIAQTCSTDWRPFQPGGTVLPGANKEEQDASFLGELVKRNLLVATGKVVTVEDAKKAFAEIQAVDLRQLPIGIPLPRWSEDRFNGKEHRDINDYMAPVPTVPNKPSEYFGIEDAYLANPTDAGLYKLLDENRKNMNDLGYVKKFAVPQVKGSNCGLFPDSTTWIMDRVTKPKRLNVIVTAHLFREEIKNPGSFYKRPASPFADAPVSMSPAFFLGGFAVEPPCYDRLAYPDWIKSFPSGFHDEFPEVDLANGAVENATDRVTHNWMTLGQILDPSLIATDGMQDNKIHYWAFRNFVQDEIHLPFMYMHRIATQATYWSKMRGTANFPKVSGPFNNAGAEWLHPLLATNNQESAGLQSAVSANSKSLRSADANRFKGNMMRVMMLLSRDMLQKGNAIQSDQNDDHCLSVTCQTGEMFGFVDQLKSMQNNASDKATLTAQGFDFNLYETNTRALLSEVQGLLAKAPRK